MRQQLRQAIGAPLPPLPFSESLKMPKYYTSDELEFLGKLANANLERINRTRRGLKMPPISRDGLLRNYIESGKERDWHDVDGPECLATAEKMRNNQPR